MFRSCCRCCFSQNVVLLPFQTKSSHNDGKTLWDYLASVLQSFVNELVTPQYICLRCSKALQIAYHFINMVKENEIVTKNSPSYKNETMDKMNIKDIKQKMTIGKQSPQSNLVSIQIPDKPFNFGSQFDLPFPKFHEEFDLFELNSSLGVSTSKGEPNFQKFGCIICNKTFDNKQLLVDHNGQDHKELLPFKCKMCNFYSCYTESLFKHYKKVHGLINVELKLYETKGSYNIIEEDPKFEIIYKCVNCNFESSTQDERDDHLLKIHGTHEDNELLTAELFKCPTCHRCFNALKSARIHYTRYHNSSFKGTKTYGNKKHVCEKCGSLFDLSSGLLLHKRMCDLNNGVHCNFCEIKFTSVLKYEQHLQAKHLVAIKHECEICDKTFSCSEYLTVHRKRHNERYHQCDLCSKNYISNAELKIHKQRIHGKIFTHLTVSRGNEKKEYLKRSSYKCDSCDFKSHSKFSLKVHQYGHTGKPYKCQLCPKGFVFRKDFRQHCERHHSVTISNEEMADMFKQTYGYTSRFDAFSQKSNNLAISEINDLELESELEEFGLTLQDIMEDLFVGEYNK